MVFYHTKIRIAIPLFNKQMVSNVIICTILPESLDKTRVRH